MAALGVTAAVINTVFPAGRAARNPHLTLSSDRERQLLSELEGLKTRYSERGMQIDHSVGAPEPNKTEGCPGGHTVYFVAANGDVSTCSWLYKIDPARFRLGNLWKSSFAEVRANVEAMMRPVRALATHCPLPAISS
jgi:MoaA/NifB/PqqE/SkfB family radical SAM enzyme